jgi:hypothetical protein
MEIYKIIHIPTQSFYIGSTKYTSEKRFKQHMYLLRKDKHNVKMQKVFTKESDFTYEVLEYFSGTLLELLSKEFELIHELQPDLNANFDAYNPVYDKDTLLKIAKSNSKYSTEQYANAFLDLMDKPREDSSIVATKYGLTTSIVNHIRGGSRYELQLRSFLGDEVYEIGMRNLKYRYPTIVSPDGELYDEVTSLSAFCREQGLTQSKMSNVCNGYSAHHKNWTII